MADLSSYSIMSTTIPSKSSNQPNYHINKQKVLLPPLSLTNLSFKSYNSNSNNNIILPPLNFSSNDNEYFFNRSIMSHKSNSFSSFSSSSSSNSSSSSGSSSCSSSSYISATSSVSPTLSSSSTVTTIPSYQQLTESNLSRFDNSKHSNGLGLLSTAILYDQQDKSTIQSVPSSLISASSSVTSISTPNTPEITHDEIQKIAATTTTTTNTTTTNTTTTNTTTTTPPNTTSKRRQRLGPSCDACRIRKVKCNADISIISKDLNHVINLFNLTFHQQNILINEDCLQFPDYFIIFHNDKFIKFKSCNSCDSKNLKCNFSKGFTREDIMNNKRNTNHQSMTESSILWNSDINVYDKDIIPLSIAKTIAAYLSIQDLLTFSLVSRNSHKAINDPKIWVSMLKTMEVWQHAIPITKDDLKKNNSKIEYLENPLTCLDFVYKSSKNAKYQILKIHKNLYPYYSDLLVNKSYNKLKIFKDFQTPEDQAKILNNLLIYNRIDYVQESRIIAHDKICELIEIFENALLRELEIHFDIEDYEKTRKFVLILVSLKNQQTLIDFFLQKSIFDEDKDLFNNFQGDSYFKSDGLNLDAFDQLINDIAEVFNEQSTIIDLIFPQSIPMMYKVCEELISNRLNELLMLLIESSKKINLYVIVIPFMYEKLVTVFINRLKPSINLGSNYQHLVNELIDMSFESFAAEYILEEVSTFKIHTKEKLIGWKNSISKREQETTAKILDQVKVESKKDFLTSFKNVFSNKVESRDDKFSEIQAKAKILSENIKTLDKIFSPELIVESLNDAKLSLNRLLKFKNYTIASLRNDISQSVQDIFVEVMDIIGLEHLRPGFEKALTYLQTYNPNSHTYSTSHNESFAEPLVLFFDLINMADIIIQMIDFFYKEELLNTQIIKYENSILNPSLQTKKKLEGLVDRYVADGLNIGIEILVDQLESVYKENLLDADYNPTEATIFGTTKAANKAVKILEENMNLLVDNAEKSVVDVFQQEIAERFFQIVVKILKKQTISVNGAPNLISDLNLYFEFISSNIKTNKKLVLPLYQALKKVGNIYLISGDDSKAIGKLVSDLSKFNGIFTQEEIYEFVQRREDWPLIKRHVEKVMYGFGLGDCKVM
ncbi:unnamed protein product [Candida verbasci]|uniref:F-box domain-containing protein n=1 Tax=Candida verbasci TaxID=1227364 RepID=A0A9W4TYE7_9ASCO|nr:unnamed protein product [Candida verbasci]